MLDYTNNIPGWIHQEEMEWLYETAKSMESIVEIGSWKGKSTHALLSGIPSTGAVYAIDHWNGQLGDPDVDKNYYPEVDEKDVFDQFLRNTRDFNNLIPMKMTSMEALKMFKPGQVDMLFIDGSHTYEGFKKDFYGWREIPRKLLCGHDVQWEGIKKVLEESGLKYQICKTIWYVYL
jgi:predicted O-methyltransferase YrrM